MLTTLSFAKHKEAGFFEVEIPASPSGVIYLDEATLGVSPTSAVAIVITSDANFTVAVQTPKATETYAPYPLSASNSANANELFVVRGRWKRLKITTTGKVWVAVDTVVGCWP
jgi:hypothetical protein